MTNMDMVGLASALVFLGVPILCIVIVAGYLAHRSAIKKNKEQGIQKPVNVNTPRMVHDLIVRPDTFFLTVSEKPATLFMPFLWLLIAGIVISVGLMAGSNPLILAAGFGNVLFLNLLAIVLMTVSIVLAWTGASGIFYVLSGLFGGSGSFRKTLQNTGYGLAPGLVLYGLALLLIPLALAIFQAPVTSPGNPVPQDLVLALIVTGGTLIASLWSFILMTHGLRHSRNISRAKAAVSVGVPVIIFLIFSNLRYLAPS
ncbi:MAG TPA: Yip1 family protein [Methanoregula sp.]|nr:Yip1 family protein [Methanoregula sp.]